MFAGHSRRRCGASARRVRAAVLSRPSPGVRRVEILRYGLSARVSCERKRGKHDVALQPRSGFESGISSWSEFRFGFSFLIDFLDPPRIHDWALGHRRATARISRRQRQRHAESTLIVHKPQPCTMLYLILPSPAPLPLPRSAPDPRCALKCIAMAI